MRSPDLSTNLLIQSGWLWLFPRYLALVDLFPRVLIRFTCHPLPAQRNTIAFTRALCWFITQWLWVTVRFLIMEAKELRNENEGTKADITKGNVSAVESGTTDALDPAEEKKLIRKIDLQ